MVKPKKGIVVAILAEEKCWKTSMGLSFPKPLYHFDLDVGGFDRAAWRPPIPEMIEMGLIVSKSYPIMIQVERLRGAEVTKSASGLTVRMPKRLIGYRETWQDIMSDYLELIESPFRTLMFDSATQLWKIAHKTELQIKQEKQIAKTPGISDYDVRESLQSIEYGAPNDRMSSIIYAARVKGKNLILTHYLTAVYASKVNDRGELISYDTGNVKMDGFNDTTKLVDIVLKLSMKEVVENGQKEWKSLATITTCGLPGLGTSVTGLTIDASYSALRDLADNLGYKMEAEIPEG